MSQVHVETRVVTSLSQGARACVVAGLLLAIAVVYLLFEPIEQPTQTGAAFRCGTALSAAAGDFAASVCSGLVRRQQLLAGSLAVAAIAVVIGGMWAFGVRRRTQQQVIHADDMFAKADHDRVED